MTRRSAAEVADPRTRSSTGSARVVRVLQLFRLPDGTHARPGRGARAARRVEPLPVADDYYTVQRRRSMPEAEPAGRRARGAACGNVLAPFNEYVHLNRRIPDEVLLTANNIADPAALALHGRGAPAGQGAGEAGAARGGRPGRAAARCSARRWRRSSRSSSSSARSRARCARQVHKNQKEFYLNEQLKAIRKELGHQNEFASEIEELGAAIKKARHAAARCRAKAMKELDRLSQDVASCRPRPPWCATTSTGWWRCRGTSATRRPASTSAKVRDASSTRTTTACKKVKERILEYLAVLKLTGQEQGPDPLLRRARRAWARPRSGKSIAARAGPQVRAHVAGRRARRGRDPRPPAHLHRLAARPHHPGLQAGRHARTRSSCSTRSTSSAPTSAATRRRRCSRCSIPSRTTPSTTTTSRSTSTCRRSCSSPRPTTLYIDPAGAGATAWRSSGCRATSSTRRSQIAQALPGAQAAQGAPGSSRATCSSPTPALRALIDAATRARPGVRNLEREIAGLCRKVARRKAAGPARRPASTSRRAACTATSGPPRYLDTAVERARRGSAWPTAWPGPRRAATCSRSR